MVCFPASIFACFMAEHSSIRIFGIPLSIAFAMPPSSSISKIYSHALSASSCVYFSITWLPPQGSIILVISVSSWIIFCVLRAILALKSVGSAIASSKLLVCKLCVPPKTAASASMVVLATLLYGSCSVRLHPLVWLCVLSAMDFGF